MEKYSQENLDIKHKQCNNFFLVICLFGIFIPLLIHIVIQMFFYRASTHLLTLIALFTAIVPIFFAYFAKDNYAAAKSLYESAPNDSKNRADKGDYLLYIGGILSIVLIALYIGISGGIKDHIMAYYFIFIPTTTAVAFNTRKGLWIVSGVSAICMSVLFACFYQQDKIFELCKYLNLAFSLYQIGLIIILEYKTNKLSEQNKQYENE